MDSLYCLREARKTNHTKQHSNGMGFVGMFQYTVVSENAENSFPVNVIWQIKEFDKYDPIVLFYSKHESVKQQEKKWLAMI